MKPSSTRHSLLVLAALTAAFWGQATHVAAQYEYTGGSTTTDWSDSGNWLLGVTPPSDGTATVTLTGTQSSSNVDTSYDVFQLIQGPGSAYTITTNPGSDLQVDSELDNLSTSPLTIAGTVDNNGQNGTFSTLSFNSGSFYVTGSVGSLINVSVSPTASLITSSTGTISSTYGVVAVGQSGGVLGGAGTINAQNGSVIVRAPDGGFVAGPTLMVGDPNANHGVGTLTVNSPDLSLNSGQNTLQFAFSGVNHSLLATSGEFDLGIVNGLGTVFGNTFDITSDGSFTPTGLYTLVTYSGSAIGTNILDAQTLDLPTGWTGNLESTDGVLALNLTDTGSPAAVPEPQTWAFLIGGLAVLGVTLRRKLGRQS